MRRVVFIRDKFNKHSMRVLIAAFEKWFPNREYYLTTPEDALKELKGNDLALFSFLTGSLGKYKKLIKEIKAMHPSINTNVGGAHATARPEEMLELFDSVSTYEGEITLKDIVEMADSSRVEGIIHGKRVENLDDFRVFPRKVVSLGPIEVTRGCPSACAYCQTPQLFKGKLRHRSVEFIAEEVRFALSRKGFADVRFIAPDASSYFYNQGSAKGKGMNLEAIEHLLYTIRNLIGTNGKLFYGTFPSEIDPAGVNKELVELLVKYCDNKQIVLGLQSASRQMQKAMHRRSGLLETENAIELFLNKNFEIVVDLIFGLPFETAETYRETYNFVERWKGKITIHSHPFDPLPGSRWEGMEATEVPADLVKLLGSLQGTGNIFGNVLPTAKKC